ncbi:MAG: prevent-host-death protein [Tannerella sp.]|nr:prevent-host-death protein [Tannerella sp.]
MAEKETVLIARKNGNPINLQVVNKDEIPSKEELKAIQRGLEDIRLGRTVEVANIDDIWSSIQ